MTKTLSRRQIISGFIAAASCGLCPATENAEFEFQWMKAALSESERPTNNSPAPTTGSEVTEAATEIWEAYRRAALQAGWDKQILPVPEEGIDVAIKEKRQPKIMASKFQAEGKEMPYVLLRRGDKPKNGWPLFISMHGGGQYGGKEDIGPHGWDVNSREWQTQMSLTAGVYKPAGLYLIPRMADDRLGRWWHLHNIKIFDQAIRKAILLRDVDPNRVYMMGISQGGYGTCHLSPFLADHLAGGGAMAGGMMTITPNLRNLAFRSDIGEKDTMYDRINLAKKLHTSLDELKSKDDGGYENVLAIQEGRGHGIDYSLSPDWLAQKIRNPHPDRVVWECREKAGIYRKNFYWLSLAETPEEGRYEIDARLDRKTNSVTVTAIKVTPGANKDDPETRSPLAADQLHVHLADDMLNLDKKVTVTINAREVFNGTVQRSRNNLRESIWERGDPNFAFPVKLAFPKN
jgi:predicted esterase